MNNIKKLRKIRGWSQTLAGEKAGGISQQMVAEYETGETELRLNVAKKFAAAFDVSVAEVMGLDAPDQIATIDDGAITATIEISTEIHVQLQARSIKLAPERYKELVHKIYKVFAGKGEFDKQVLANVVTLQLDSLGKTKRN